MKAFFNFTLILILFLTLFFVSCDRPDKSTDPDYLPGYRLNRLVFEEKLPCYVNILFQATDMDGYGVTDLTTDDFDIFEDGGPVSPSESFPQIRKYDEIPYKLKTVLMLDNSESVAANLTEIKNAAIALVNNIMDQQEIAVYVFSEDPVMVQDFTDNISDLTDAINSIEAGAPTTDLYGAVIEGSSRWTDRYTLGDILQGFMIMLTDGSDTQGSHTLDSALYARDYCDIGGHIFKVDRQIYTIGLGNEIEPDTLEIIGNAGFYAISDVSEVAGKFQEIQNEMIALANSIYYLYYMSPTRDYNQHTLRMEVKGNANDGDDSYITGTFNSEGFYTATPGVYVNVTESKLFGINTVLAVYGDTVYLEAQTFKAASPPCYVWETNCDSISLTVNIESSDSAFVTKIGNIAEGFTINVTDTANNYSLELTLAESIELPPILTTAAVSGITETTAECGGNITSDGGVTVTTRGVCWSTNATPTIADNKTSDGTGTGSFASSITGLTGNTLYYVRAYATNGVGTGYGNEVSFTNTEPIWSILAPMPTSRCYFDAPVVNNKIYAIGGYNPGCLSTVEEYNPALDSWTSKASMPTGRGGLGVATVNNKIYAIGGTIGTTNKNIVEEYDPATDTWTTKQSMPAALKYISVAVVNNKIYVIGGYKGSSAVNTVEEYDPATNTWTTKQSMPTSRYLLGTVALNNKIYAIGGSDGSINLNIVEEYDPATDTWTTKEPMPTSRYGLGVATVDNKIYAIGGSNNSVFFNIIEEYNPFTDIWTTKTPMPTARHSFGTAVINNRIYTIGGATGPSYLNVVELYNPSRD